MSSDTTLAIRAAGLSKTYFLGGGRAYGRTTLRERISEVAAAPFQRIRGNRPLDDRNRLDALCDVSFDVRQGDAVAFIGSNGAGKSTLLKVLARITHPSSGYAEVHGRVGALLEVGTGFHPELSGRENVYLNGAVLGMSRREIDRHFDAIVEFAGLERFLDTPVKRYSSGMYVRLAFSVAAHLEPEILIVDEVLAVGDTAFQRKCIARMTSVADEGRTVLFVSHNMSVLQGLCRRGIVLRSGQVIADTTIEEATAVYLRTLETARGVDLADHTGRRGWHHVRLREAKVSAADPAAPLATGSRAAFEFRFDTLVPLPPNSGLSLTFTLYNDLGQPIATFSSVHAAPSDATHQLTDLISCIVDELPLVAGRYRIDVALRGAGHLQDEVQGALWFDVEHGLFRGRPTPETAFGSTVIPHVWRLPSDV